MGPPHEPLATVFAPGAQRTRSLSLDTKPKQAPLMTQLAVAVGLTIEPNPTPCWGGGEIQSREARGESDNPPFPLLVGILPRWPPPNLGARFGRILLPRVLLFSVMTTFYMTTFQTDHCFFFGFDLQRNHFIRSVALVEGSSILLPPRRLEAC